MLSADLLERGLSGPSYRWGARGKANQPVLLGQDGQDVLINLLGIQVKDCTGVTDFFAKVWQKCPMVVRGRPEKAAVIRADYLFDLDVLSMLENSASDMIHVWLKTAEAWGRLDSIQVDAAQALKLYAAGHSLYCRAPPALEQELIPSMLASLGMGPASSLTDRFRRGEIETFFSRAGHTTEFHSDFQENFTLQLSGVKRWSFVSSTLVAPLRGCTPHFGEKQPPEVVETQMKILRMGDPAFRADQFKDTNRVTTSVTLYPGDVLYHPAGLWHRVECLEDSISINVSLVGSSLADLCGGAVQQLLWKHQGGRFRRAVCVRDSLAAMREAEGALEALKAAVAELRPADLLPGICFREVPRGGREGEEKDVDEEAEDEEKEEEEEGNERIIYASRLDAGSEVEYTSFASAGRYRLNPLASIISGADLKLAGWRPPAEVAGDEEDYSLLVVVHVGFGNEGFESLARAVVHLGGCLESPAAAHHVLQRLTGGAGAVGGGVWTAEQLLPSDTELGAGHKRKRPAANAKGLNNMLFALYLAGALAPAMG